MKTENKIFIIVFVAIIGVFILFTSVLLTIGYYNVNFTNKKNYLPEEIDIAKEGDLLQVERVTNDSIYLGFKH